MSLKSNKLTPITLHFTSGSNENPENFSSSPPLSLTSSPTKNYGPIPAGRNTEQYGGYTYPHHPGSTWNGSRRREELQHLYVLPVLLMEFLALALTRAIIPELLLMSFGDNIYFVMGCAECIRGLLAFISCPLFGKISDIVGRKVCLLVTVFGTCLPVCMLAVLTWHSSKSTYFATMDTTTTKEDEYNGVVDYRTGGGRRYMLEAELSSSSYDDNEDEEAMMMRRNMKYFVFLLAVSGIFSSTFTLTFAYISDTVRKRKDRVSAYGLALATFGLSFTIGPMAGGYLAHVEDDYQANAGDDDDNVDYNTTSIHPSGQRRVFTASLVLTIIDLLYIYFILPESNSPNNHNSTNNHDETHDDNDDDSSTDSSSQITSLSHRLSNIRRTMVLPDNWSPIEPLRIFMVDPFLRNVGVISFLYYTALYAVISTLQLYSVRRFHLGPERLGELMSALGLSTMISEAVLVRIVVPAIGERKSMQFGLAAFVLQCTVLGLAYEGWHLFVCVIVSMGSHLVYPSLTSLVGEAVGEDMVGEALGAMNGIKALTEGLGPLFFGALMTLSENSALPGWPYLIAATLALFAYRRSQLLPDENDEVYISERYLGNGARRWKNISNSDSGGGCGQNGGNNNALISALNVIINSPIKPKSSYSSSSNVELELMGDGRQQQQNEEEFVSLLSDIDEMVDEDGFLTSYSQQASLEAKQLEETLNRAE